MIQFLEECKVTPQTRILDVGGWHQTWRGLPFQPNVVLLDRKPIPCADMPIVRADALALPFPDKSFDLVFCNSVIEHLTTAENQHRMAAELRRVGVRYYVQTPNFWFPFEPHFLCPGFQYLPKTMRTSFAWRLTPWAWITRPPADYARTAVDQVRLLTRSQLKLMFPGSCIQAERFLGLAKSFVVFGG